MHFEFMNVTQYIAIKTTAYSGVSIIQTPIIRIQTFGRWLRSPCFWYQREKDVAVTGVLLQEKAKLLHERLSRTLQRFFSMQYGI